MATDLDRPMSTNTADPAPRWTLDPSVRHLNHGSFGALPEAVQAEQNRLRRLTEWNPVRWFAALPKRIAEARGMLAGSLSVDPEHLAFVPNASAGASVVYQSLLGTGPVDILVTDHGYGAVTMGARRLAHRTGGTLRTARVPLEASAATVVEILQSDLERYRPDLVVIDQITSSTARKFPVDEVCRLVREAGARTLVDGAHAPGSLADPVCGEADYWVANLHKFACAPRGAAVLVTRDEGDELFPLIDSWGTELPFPYRFDHTGTMDVTPWLTAPFAWQHIESTLGWDAWRNRSRSLLQAAGEILAEPLSGGESSTGVDVGQPVDTMRLFALPDGLGTNREEADALRIPFSDATGIACAFTSFGGRGYLRLSAHAYNSIHDYRYLAEVGVPVLHQWATGQSRHR